MSKPYAGAPVSQLFRERWLNPERMVAGARPVGMVEIRRGHLKRSYHPYPGKPYFSEIFGDFPQAIGTGFWFPEWVPESDWMTLDAVESIKLDQSFEQNGVQTCTITMDNINLVPTTGAAGILYHLVQKGYYSPLRGFVAPGRANPGVTKTPFFKKLPNAQIRIRQGYGEDALVTTFLGLIDDVESASIPNQLTITARDHGGVLVDEFFFGWAKDRTLRAPITFAPRSIAEHTRIVGGDAKASSSAAGNPPAGAVQDDPANWVSEGQHSSDRTEWIEITIPNGRYSKLYLSVPYDDMHAYIAIKPKGFQTTGPHGTSFHHGPTFNGKDITSQLDGEGWWNPYGKSVPGAAHGGWSYFAEIGATQAGPGRHISLRGLFEVGDGTVVRIGFRNLAAVDGSFDAPGSTQVYYGQGQVYAAAVGRLGAVRRQFTEAAIKGQYIAIDDISDIVRVVARWAGFKGWEIENTGVNLQEVYVADVSKTLMDLINVAKDQTGFTFFMGEPRDDSDDQDLGYPIFRNNRVYENRSGHTEFIDDRLLLTDAKVKISNQDDRTIIRCRGIAKKTGVITGGDDLRRIMYAYIPPWVGDESKFQAGVLKPITHTDELFTRLTDCQFGCYLIALQIALSKYTVIMDLPGNPGIGLDTLQSVIDRTQGLNSRVYVTNRSQEMKFGSDGYWTMELGGSLVDTPDMAGLLKDYKKAIRILDRGGRNPWVRKRGAFGWQNH